MPLKREITVEYPEGTAVNTSARPLNAIPDAELCPGSRALASITASLR